MDSLPLSQSSNLLPLSHNMLISIDIVYKKAILLVLQRKKESFDEFITSVTELATLYYI